MKGLNKGSWLSSVIFPRKKKEAWDVTKLKQIWVSSELLEHTQAVTVTEDMFNDHLLLMYSSLGVVQ